MNNERFDYVIVGAGSAGAVLAARLTESNRHRVCLIEAGGEDRNVWIHIPLGIGKLLSNERYAWKFETEPQPAMHSQRIYWPRGKVLGGSSCLNGMAYIWGDPAEFDAWRSAGCVGWGFEEVLPYFQRLESNIFTSQSKRGRDGPMRITDRAARERDALSDGFVDACKTIGIPETPDYNVVSYEGVRYLEQTAFNGRRWSTAVGYLRPARRRPNLRIEKCALVTRVLFDGRRATGVEYLKAGQKHSVRAAREVLLCCGAIQSPQLLELSGVGDGARLQALGIPVVADMPAVGENMSDHLQVRCTYQTTLPITINDLMNSLTRRMLAGVQYVLTRKGLIANTSSTAHAITRTSPSLTRPDVMIRIYHISGTDRYSRSGQKGLDPYSGFSIGGFKLYPASRGSIHIASTDPSKPPLIQPNYLAHPEDRDTAVALLRLVRTIASQPAFRQLVVAEQRPGPAVADDGGLLEYVRESGQTAWHTVGTCRLGQSPRDSVVDPRLWVHGLHGLRVADASVMPTIVSSNTNAPSIMIGEKAAAMILEDTNA